MDFRFQNFMLRFTLRIIIYNEMNYFRPDGIRNIWKLRLRRQSARDRFAAGGRTGDNFLNARCGNLYQTSGSGLLAADLHLADMPQFAIAVFQQILDLTAPQVTNSLAQIPFNIMRRLVQIAMGAAEWFGDDMIGYAEFG